jgi:hypothetical protein
MSVWRVPNPWIPKLDDSNDLNHPVYQAFLNQNPLATLDAENEKRRIGNLWDDLGFNINTPLLDGNHFKRFRGVEWRAIVVVLARNRVSGVPAIPNPPLADLTGDQKLRINNFVYEWFDTQ